MHIIYYARVDVKLRERNDTCIKKEYEFIEELKKSLYQIYHILTSAFPIFQYYPIRALKVHFIMIM